LTFLYSQPGAEYDERCFATILDKLHAENGEMNDELNDERLSGTQDGILQKMANQHAILYYVT
jgi:hypothetical protein